MIDGDDILIQAITHYGYFGSRVLCRVQFDRFKQLDRIITGITEKTLSIGRSIGLCYFKAAEKLVEDITDGRRIRDLFLFGVLAGQLVLDLLVVPDLDAPNGVDADKGKAVFNGMEIGALH